MKGLYLDSFLATGIINTNPVAMDYVPLYWQTAYGELKTNDVDIELTKYHWPSFTQHQKDDRFLMAHNITHEDNIRTVNLPTGVRTFPDDNYLFWTNCAKASLVRFNHSQSLYEMFSTACREYKNGKVPTHWKENIALYEQQMLSYKSQFKLSMDYRRKQVGLFEMNDLTKVTRNWLVVIDLLYKISELQKHEIGLTQRLKKYLSRAIAQVQTVEYCTAPEISCSSIEQCYLVTKAFLVEKNDEVTDECNKLDYGRCIRFNQAFFYEVDNNSPINELNDIGFNLKERAQTFELSIFGS
ncbi:hypothetical protein A1QO_04170 [Vibrio genomosp. F10 str. ZF-129]|uniref:Uncharacterized protein n=1 Tax=Vibrio genomosp. F10 str. ZF-129 TaxID=1187848 RepID=A0A1E5BIR3_9VIBR|nr:hypothetical protein [Vibrio genomosp. F10]OEE37308.1 hypothetical protein A1QO_04170 [Vibrio genomosp. F10 str. ZF-129]